MNSNKPDDWFKDLTGAIAEIDDADALERFFGEIFTPAEREKFALRWELMAMLKDGHSQRDIASKLHISLCKVTRGAKVLKDETSVTNQILQRKENVNGKENLAQ